MRKFNIIFALLFLLVFKAFSQEIVFRNLIEDTQKVARRTGYQGWVEYTSDFKTTEEKENKMPLINAYETFCSRKTCISIQTIKDGKNLSEKQIQKNREKTSKTLINAEKSPDGLPYAKRENSMGYGIMIYTWFNPSLYLKTCKSEFIEELILNDRPTTKVKVNNCNLDELTDTINKTKFLFMTKTEGVIWIDNQDTAIVKMEIYPKKDFKNSSNTNKAIVIMEATRIPAGYWFWKSIKLEALENKAIFPEYKSNWNYEFYNYRLSTVDIDKAEVIKKSN